MRTIPDLDYEIKTLKNFYDHDMGFDEARTGLIIAELFLDLRIINEEILKKLTK